MTGGDPPVMLMICWLPAAKLNRENGIETEMPGCKIKRELREERKRAENNIEQRHITSQPK
jgi:hypothetical protein